ncbi:hypothetical protein [Blastopirellula sediminis]|nr:hypothetical protein [Blastopirellula sediminis]
MKCASFQILRSVSAELVEVDSQQSLRRRAERMPRMLELCVAC